MKIILHFTKLMFLVFAMNVFSCKISAVEISSLELNNERFQTNVIDAMLFTILSEGINDYLLHYPTSTLRNIFYGVGSWISGELIEAAYKHILKKHFNKNLREELGKSKIFGIDIDHQRLLRRAVTLVFLHLASWARPV